MGSRVDLNRVAELLDGDPLLTPIEAAEELGIYVEELKALTDAGMIRYIEPVPDKGRGGVTRRYRTSVVAAMKAAGVPDIPQPR
jgi:hypothetical protein